MESHLCIIHVIMEMKISSDINKEDEDGETPLHLIHYACHYACLSSDENIFCILNIKIIK